MAKKTTLTLMIHCSTDRQPDPPLSFIGLTEAHMAAEKTAGWSVDQFLSSPAKRCMSTARILAKQSKKEVKPDDRLASRDADKMRSFFNEIGSMEGKSVLAIADADLIKFSLTGIFGVEPSKIDINKLSPLAYSVIEFDGAKAKVERLLVPMFSESSKVL